MGRNLEKYLPLAIALLLLAITLLYGKSLTYSISSDEIKPTNLYTSLFNLFAILVAFLFAFYTFVRTAETSFLQKFRKTNTFGIFVRYVLHGCLTSALAILITLPLLVFEPKPSRMLDGWFVYILLWLTISAYALASSGRAAVIFAVLTGVDLSPNTDESV